jgi:hypothetical protein
LLTLLLDLDRDVCKQVFGLNNLRSLIFLDQDLLLVLVKNFFLRLMGFMPYVLETLSQKPLDLSNLAFPVARLVVFFVLKGRSHHVHVVLSFIGQAVPPKDVKPVTKDIRLTVVDVGPLVLHDPVEGVLNDGNEDVEEDDLGHEERDQEPHPQDQSHGLAFINRVVFKVWLPNHDQDLVDKGGERAYFSMVVE